MATKLTHLEVFEGSLVDAPANKHAQVVLFKRAAVEKAGMKCPDCGAAMGDASTCPECGAKMKKSDNPAESGRGEGNMPKVNKTEGAAETQTETKVEEPKTEIKADEPKAEETAKADTLKAELAKRDAEIAELKKSVSLEIEKRELIELQKRLDKEFAALPCDTEKGASVKALREVHKLCSAETVAEIERLMKAGNAALALGMETVGKSGDGDGGSAAEKVDKLCKALVSDGKAKDYAEAFTKLGSMPEHRALLTEYAN